MGEVQSEICEVVNYLCGEESAGSENEIKSQLMGHDQPHGIRHAAENIDPSDSRSKANGTGATEEKYSANEGYYHQINANAITVAPERSPIITQIEVQCDHYFTEMLHKKIQEIINQNTTNIDYPLCTQPTPYTVLHIDYKTVRVSCCPFEQHAIYQLPVIDEYFGDLCAVHNYDKANRYLINKRMSSRTLDAEQAHKYMDANIYKRLFDASDRLRSRYNQWQDVDIKQLSIAKKYIHNADDLWLTLIAFSGFGAHRTKHFVEDNDQNISFLSDVNFLSLYPVRDEYAKYGAIAYFDKNYCITQIYVAHLDKMVTPNFFNVDSQEEWQHAKWVWKVSITVATFLVDMLAHCRFREATSLIRATQETLGPNHPIRRLLIPFTYGTIYANNVYNEYLKKNALFHRIFGFTYDGLSKLIKDSMNDAPQRREPRDDMKYRWKFARKKASPLRKKSDEIHLDLKTFSSIYPLSDEISSFWDDTLQLVVSYTGCYYNNNDSDDSMLVRDDELVAFYDALLNYSGITKKFKLTKFNITNTLTQFICNASIWNHHLSGSVSLDYLVDPSFTGLKLDKHTNSSGNSTQNYAEYVCAVLSTGWNLMHFQGYNVLNDRRVNEIVWNKVLLQDDNKKTNMKLFHKYFHKISKRKEKKNNKPMVPYIAGNRQCLGSSIML